MKRVNESAWHWRLNKAMGTPKSNLCPYVRQVFLNILLIMFFAFLACCVLMILTYPIWRWWKTDGWLGFLAFLGWCAISYGMMKLYREEWQTRHGTLLNKEKWYHRDLLRKLKDWYAARPAKPYVSKPPKEPNIILEWLRAKHDQLCPELEFYRDDES